MLNMNALRLLAVVGAVAAAASSLSASETRPNIVLVMADDQGWGDMGYNGHPHVKTPNFDRAASDCLRFDRFYAAAPVCSPTRASVMTGRHPNRMGVFKWGHPLRPQEVTLAEMLRDAGYATGHFGKWHLGSVRRQSPVHPGAHGFDEWLSAPNFYDNDPILSRQGKAVQLQGESSMVAADAAIDWMKKQAQAERRFLAVVWFGSPHSPHRAVSEDKQHYQDLPKNLQEFYGEITGMDRAFGKIRTAIADLGIRDNTVLWYCSDNGALPRVGHAGDFRGHKGQVYDGGLLGPAFVEWPAVIARHRATDARCNTCDILPTLLDVCGISPKLDAPIDGISLLPLWKGAVGPRPQPMGFWNASVPGIGTPAAAWMKELWAAQEKGRDLPPHRSSQRAAELPSPPWPQGKWQGHAAWIDGDWKLHRIQKKGAQEKGSIRWELYNLAVDRSETHDLAEAEPQRVRRMGEQLEQWLESVVDSLNGKDY